jgi:hypothetical protein
MDRTSPALKEPPTTAPPAKKREYLKQSDLPEFSFEEALRIPGVLAEQYGKQPTRPADVALRLTSCREADSSRGFPERRSPTS